MCDLCVETTCKHCKTYTLCLELLDGLFFCDECLGKITSIELIA